MSRAATVAGLVALAGCESDPDPCPPGMVLVAATGTTGMDPSEYAVVSTAGMSDVTAPEERCPAALGRQPEAAACWIQTDLIDPVLRPREVSVAPFCIDAFPFPGEGAPYTKDGMTTWDAVHLQELLATGAYGRRRLCTMTEFQVAVAGPTRNHRFIYGDRHDPARCTDNTIVGADPACTNPETGLHDYGAVHSHWVVADAAFVARACDQPPCRAAGRRPLTEGMLIVAGGTNRLQTRQAPLTPHTWHDHGTPNPDGCDAMGHDDQPIICADPHPDWATDAGRGAQAAWTGLVETARQRGSMTAFLETGLGRAVCPPAP